MSDHTTEELKAIHARVEKALMALASDLAKDKLCFMCGLQELILLGMTNHMLHGIAEHQTTADVSDVLRYVSYISDRFHQFILALDRHQDDVSIVRFAEDGSVVPERKNQH